MGRAAGLVVVAGFATVALVGWAVDAPLLRTGALPGQSMKVLTALALLALAAGLGRLTYGRAGRLRRWEAGAAGVAVVALGAAVLFEYTAGVTLGIDEAFVTDTATALSGSPGRPSPQTAVSLVLLGAAIVGASSARGVRWARWLALAACVIPVGALFGYLSGITSLFAIPNATGMAASTAISLLLVCLGIFLIDLDAPHLTALSEEGPRGEVLRRLLPAAVIMPTAVGVLIVRGQRFGAWGTGVGLLLLVLVSAVVTVLGVLTIARRLKRLDDARKSVVSTLADRDRRLATLVESAPIGIFQTDTEGRCQLVSPGWCAQAGMSPEGALGEMWTALVHPDDRARVRGAWATAVAGDEAFHESFRFRRADGAAVWLETRAAAMRDETGAVVGWVGTSTDVSERVAIERQTAARGRITRAVADDLDPGEIFALVAEEAARVLEGEVAAIFRREDDSLIVAGTWALEGLPTSEMGQSLPLSGPTASAVAARTARPAFVEYPVGLDPPRLDPGQPLVGLAAPVRVGGATWGAIGVGVGGPEPVAFEALATLEAFAEMVGLAVTSTDARERLQTMASTDHLTGLPNARTFHARLAQEVERARRHNRPLSLVVFDLDHFKRINDAHGHQGGDRTLSEAAKRMANEARTSETIARVGGEEFAWILPDADGFGAYAAAERVRRAVSGTPIAPFGTVTVSAGVCDLSDAADASELFRLADLALYWAKANGRDATFRYSPEALEILSADEQAERLARSRSMHGIRALARAVDAQGSLDRRPLRAGRRAGVESGRRDGVVSRTCGPDAGGGPRPRRRQDRRARWRAAEARSARPRRVRRDPDPRRSGRHHRGGGAHGGAVRMGASPPRARGRHGLSRRLGPRADERGRLHPRPRRRVGRDDLAPLLPRGPAGGRGPPGAASRIGLAVLPADGRCVPSALGRRRGRVDGGDPRGLTAAGEGPALTPLPRGCRLTPSSGDSERIAMPSRIASRGLPLVLLVLVVLAALPVAALGVVRFDRQWAIPGGAGGEAGVAVDRAGAVVYVADPGFGATGRILAYNRDGTLLRVLDRGSGVDVERPLGLAVDSAGNLAVFEGDRNRVSVLSPTGVTLRAIAPTGDAAFDDLAAGIAIDAADNLYVADTRASRIQVFGPTGAPLRTFGLGGGFVTDVTADATGNVYAELISGDGGCQATIQKHSPSGVLLARWNVTQSPAYNCARFGLGVDARTGEVLVSSQGGTAPGVRRYTPDGALVGAPLLGAGARVERLQAVGLAVDGTGTIYVRDTSTPRILKFADLPPAPNLESTIPNPKTIAVGPATPWCRARCRSPRCAGPSASARWSSAPRPRGST